MRATLLILLAAGLALAGCAGPEQSNEPTSDASSDAQASEDERVAVPAGGEIDADDQGEHVPPVLVEQTLDRSFDFDSQTRRIEALLVVSNEGEEDATVQLALAGASEATEEVTVPAGGAATARLVLDGDLGDDSPGAQVRLLVETDHPVTVTGTVYHELATGGAGTSGG